MTNLTLANYHSPENHFISNSKIGDFLKDKQYFSKKHRTFEIETKLTDALIIGSAVDTWITQGEEVFNKLYLTISRRKSVDADYRFQLNPTMRDKIEKMCRALERQTALKEIRDAGYQAQHILTKEMPIGEFQGLCVMMDWFKVEGNKATILDLKTSETINPRKYHWHCLDYNYYRQMAMSDIVVRANFPEVTTINYGHLVLGKDADEIYTCQTFWLDKDRVAEERLKINEVIEQIKNEKDWLPNNTSWEDAIEIGALTEEF